MSLSKWSEVTEAKVNLCRFSGGKGSVAFDTTNDVSVNTNWFERATSARTRHRPVLHPAGKLAERSVVARASRRKPPDDWAPYAIGKPHRIVLNLRHGPEGPLGRERIVDNALGSIKVEAVHPSSIGRLTGPIGTRFVPMSKGYP
jgi:hypothetical protein